MQNIDYFFIVQVHPLRWSICMNMNGGGFHHDEHIEPIFHYDNEAEAQAVLEYLNKRKVLTVEKATRYCCKRAGINYNTYCALTSGNREHAEKCEAERIIEHIKNNWETIEIDD